MPRRPRILLPGFPHHVTHRGNRKTSIYIEAEDRRVYLEMLQKYCECYRTRIYSYCLMTNHIHLVAVPETRTSLSRCMHDLHGHYAQLFNHKYRVTGHLWEERFYACVLDADHLWNAVRYVEQNPIRSRMIEIAEDYPWSSAAAHCGLKEDKVLDKSFPPNGLISNWSNWLSSDLPVNDTEQIRNATRRGIPCGSKSFLTELESMLKIPLLPRKRGRTLSTLMQPLNLVPD
ncbi:MAG: transposase [Acidobacteriota bacterium]